MARFHRAPFLRFRSRRFPAAVGPKLAGMPSTGDEMYKRGIKDRASRFDRPGTQNRLSGSRPA